MLEVMLDKFNILEIFIVSFVTKMWNEVIKDFNVAPVHTWKVKGGGKEKLHPFLNLALGGGP